MDRHLFDALIIIDYKQTSVKFHSKCKSFSCENVFQTIIRENFGHCAEALICHTIDYSLNPQYERDVTL